MSESKHTPGPWEYGPGYDGQPVIYIDRGLGNHIAYISNGGVPEEAEAANTRLIAAAPDLLEALCLAHDYLAANGWEGDPRMAPIEAAIAKAEGRS